MSKFRSVCTGFLLGFPIGIAGVLAIVFLCIWNELMEWSIVFGAGLPYLLAFGGLGAVNGAIGGWDAGRAAPMKIGVIIWIPLALLAIPLSALFFYVGDSKSWGPIVMFIVLPIVFVLLAGKIGATHAEMVKRKIPADIRGKIVEHIR